VAVVQFSRPPHNYFDGALIGAIADAYERLDEDHGCRAIVLCSEGKHFCAGANFAAKNPAEGDLYEQAVRLFAARKPVVAAVQGAAVGGGLGVARCRRTSAWPAPSLASAPTLPGWGSTTASA